MGMRNPGSTSQTRKQAWIGLLLLSATLAASAWFGTYRQSVTEHHAYTRCTATAGGCARPESSPVWAFAAIALVLIVVAGWVAVRRKDDPH